LFFGYDQITNRKEGLFWWSSSRAFFGCLDLRPARTISEFSACFSPSLSDKVEVILLYVF
jgi:hypothetical protein